MKDYQFHTPTRKHSHGGHSTNSTHVNKKRIVDRDKKKHSHSYTKTKTEEEGLHGNLVPSSISSQNTVIPIHEPYKMTDWSAGKLTWTTNTSGTLGANAGQQSCVNLCYYGTTSQWMLSTGTSTTLFGQPISAMRYFDINPSDATTGSATLAGTTKPATDKLVLTRVQHKMKICNFSSAPMTTWIYCLESVSDHNLSPVDAFGSATAVDDGSGSIGAAGFIPSSVSTGGSIGYPNIQFPGNNPANLSTFKKLWRVKHVHRVDLTGGAEEDYSMTLKMNLIGDANRLIELQNNAWTQAAASWTAGSIVTQYPRGCVAVMSIQLGGVVKNLETGNPTTSSTDIGFLINGVHHFKPMKNQISKLNANLAYDQVTTGSALSNQGVITTQDVVSNLAGTLFNVAKAAGQL